MLEPEASAAQKQHWLKMRLAPWAAALRPLRGADASPRWGYRDRVCLSTLWEDGKWQFGLVRRGELIPIPQCPVHSDRVRATIEILGAALPDGNRFPMVFYVQSGAQTTLILKTARLPASDWLRPAHVTALAERNIEGLWLHLHPAAGKRLYTKNGWRLLWGNDRSRDGLDLLHGPSSFQQVRATLYQEALDTAQRFLAPSPSVGVVDLYCGTGASLARWTALGSRCIGVELNGEAVDCAQRNAPGTPVLRGQCAQRLPQIDAWLSATDGSATTKAIYCNPPRTGLETEVLDWIVGVCRPARLAYLSCSAGTLARDLARLTGTNFDVVDIIPYEFFPQTPHVETLALLRRRDLEVASAETPAK